ncbi:MAG: thiamine pyrophosphate-binding protein [Chloroflexia bacterium]
MLPKLTQCMLYAFQKCHIDWLAVVPSTGLNEVYDYYNEQGRCLFATREEEAVAICAGLAMTGKRPLVLMQQSGVGNALNAVFTLAQAYAIYFPIVVCDRSSYDPNPVQRHSSVSTWHVLESLGSVFLDWTNVNASERFSELLDRQQRWIISTLVGEK